MLFLSQLFSSSPLQLKSIVYFPGMWRQPTNVNNFYPSFSQSQAEGTVNFATFIESVWKRALGLMIMLTQGPTGICGSSEWIFPCISGLLCVLSKYLCDLTHKQPTSLPSRTLGRTQSCLLTALSVDQARPCSWVSGWGSPPTTSCTMHTHFVHCPLVCCDFLCISLGKSASRDMGLNPRMAFPVLGRGPHK